MKRKKFYEKNLSYGSGRIIRKKEIYLVGATFSRDNRITNCEWDKLPNSP